MALIKSVELDTGIVLPSGFAKVCRISHDIINNAIDIEVILFKDQTAYLAGKPEVGFFSYNVMYTAYDTYFNEALLKSSNITLYTQAEVYLLSLPFFSGATQV